MSEELDWRSEDPDLTACFRGRWGGFVVASGPMNLGKRENPL